jgi:hypothetical protein
MIFPEKYRNITISIFVLIWLYLIYCYFFGCGHESKPHNFNYKSRVDSTISLLETWKKLVFTQSEIKVHNSQLERDSILRELRKKPKVLIVPKTEIQYVEKLLPEVSPKVMNYGPSTESFENAELRIYNSKLEKEIDSLNKEILKLREKSIKDSARYKYTEQGKIKRRFFSNFFKKKTSGPVEGDPEFR